MAQRHVRVLSKVGLHARPAALFVQTATKAPAEVTVAKPGKDPVNAKSILAVLGLDVRHGEEITISVEGEDAERLLDELEAAVNVEAESA
ncbi:MULTISPECIES: HPr family phosphocarrier protein [Thermomonospora]|uniref:Phosphocarrier protein HPr n=1 Tax=Thermomonospora cellulosilytica TaxID=1411118 RepID=A0A7W3N5E5_9ACTN|nr:MULTISPECIES: HPr family phosphocarrier protein [Thermomonospora]MBA9007869.1 phosphocarrier protein [Thermomonospora cellulosilytica]